MRLLITYDIADVKRLVKVSRRLEQSATRVQRSVFETDLTDRALERLLTDLNKLLDPAEDSLRVYRLCAECAGQTRIIGQGVVVRAPGLLIL